MCDIYFIEICSFNVIIEDASDRLHFTFGATWACKCSFYGRMQIHEKKKVEAFHFPRVLSKLILFFFSRCVQSLVGKKKKLFGLTKRLKVLIFFFLYLNVT